MGNELKVLKSPNYNYVFNNETGEFARWGATLDDDPEYSPFGPELLDIEISTVCHQGCSFCYKTNVSEGDNMSLETFKTIFNKIPKTLTQIAFGIGSLNSCPDLYKIMEYCRDNDHNKVVPNITINGTGLTKKDAERLASVVGAVAVSRYSPDVCYNAVEMLHEAGIGQVNIHQLLCEDTYERCLQLIEDIKTDSRLKHLRAAVFLLMKPKGGRNVYTQLRSMDKYKKLVDLALDNDIPIGFDSCSAPHFVKSVEGRPNFKQLYQSAEPCESTRFSLYINVHGKAWACSFCEDHQDPEIGEPIDVLNAEDFLKDVWFHPRLVAFRERLHKSRDRNGCENCPAFDLRMT